MQILIVDDEAPARHRLRRLLAELDADLEVVDEAASGLEALRVCISDCPELVLLDLQMPVMGGLECARELTRLPKPPAIVFVTAFDDAAVEAFELAAVDYVLKPVRRERLQVAIERARRRDPGNRTSLPMSLPSPARSHLCIVQHGEITRLPIADVRYFYAEHKDTRVRTVAGKLIIPTPLKELETEFTDRFVRAHRSALVAVPHIECLERLSSDVMALRLNGIPERIEVSRRQINAVRQRLQSG